MRGPRHPGSASAAGHFGSGRQAGRKTHCDGQADAGPGTDFEVGSVGLGDVGDDGQAKAMPVRAGGPVRGGALEGFEQSADLVWRYGGPVLVTVSVASVTLAVSLTPTPPPVVL